MEINSDNIYQKVLDRDKMILWNFTNGMLGIQKIFCTFQTYLWNTKNLTRAAQPSILMKVPKVHIPGKQCGCWANYGDCESVAVAMFCCCVFVSHEGHQTELLGPLPRGLFPILVIKNCHISQSQDYGFNHWSGHNSLSKHISYDSVGVAGRAVGKALQ